MTDALKAKLNELPSRPGVYFHRSADGEIIYVGKAARLKNRVRQYFQKSRLRDVKTDALVAEITDVDWIETDSEIDALFLESEMVKRYLPRYNVLLRDDKSETFVRIDMKSPWPTVTLTRLPSDDGAEYIGPFYNAYTLKKALRYLRRVFPYYTRPPKQTDSRLEQQIGLVPTRASGEQALQAYKSNLKQLIRYIKGERRAIVEQLEKDMQRAARQHRFEEAAQIRNRLRHMKELQNRVMFGDSEYIDISKDIALSDLAKILGIEEPLRRIECIDISHHSGEGAVAGLVVFINGVSSRSDYRKFRVSDRNDDYANLAAALKRRFSVKNLQQWPAPQLLIIDGGKGQLSAALEAVRPLHGSLPIIGLVKGDDTMVVHADSKVRPITSQSPKNSLQQQVDSHQEGQYEMINLHPSRYKSSGHARNLRGSVQVFQYREVTKLLQRIRDESHRFSVSYHHTVRSKNVRSSKLALIPGVGPVTQRKLLKTFGSLRGVQSASQAELSTVVGPVLAKRLISYLGEAKSRVV